MIRPARAADAPALAAIQSHLDAPSPELLATFAAFSQCLVSVDVESDPIDGTTTSVDLERHPDARPADRGEEAEEGRPVGYVLAIGGDDLHVAELVVDPAYRREGRGRALLRAVIDRAEPGTRVTLAVAADNEAARSLYESVGFQSVDYRPGFYDATDAAHSDDAVVYAYEVENGAQSDEVENGAQSDETADGA